MSESSEPPTCRNCGSSQVQQFCPVCGQENVPSALPVRELLQGFLEELLKFDTKIWVTLKALVTKPGFLTNEYLDGRRVRYVAPIKLYLALSFVLFLVFAFFPQTEKNSDSGGDLTGMGSGIRTAQTLLDLRATPAPAQRITPARTVAPTPEPDESPEDFQKRLASQRHADACADVAMAIAVREKKQRDTLRRDAWVSANRSTLNVMRIPLLALLLAFLLRKDAKRLYVEHLTFALHSQSFDLLRELATIVVGLIPLLGGLLGLVLTIGGLAYFVLAAQAVYKLPLKRLIGLTIAFLVLATLATWVTGYTAGIVYRLSG